MAFSLDNNHIAVNYHYVQDPRLDAGGIHPCSIAEFKRQIAFLSGQFQFVSLMAVYEAAKHRSSQRLCAITFDDGLQSQWENALPVLRQYGALATFFIITGTLDGKIPLAHKIHIVSSRISPLALIEKFNLFLLRAFPQYAHIYHIPLNDYVNNKRRHDDIPSANLKEILSNIALHTVSDAFLSEVLNELDMNEKYACGKFFMNQDQIYDLQCMGFIVETHTHNHYSLDRESSEALREDFRAATNILKRILGKSPHVMAYPYGRLPMNDRILAEFGITHGVTVENRAIDADNHPLRIPRFDTNDVKDFLNLHG